MRSRDRMEIMSQILEAAAKNGRSGGHGATKTRLMFNAFLSHGQLKHYLSILADNGLLQYDSVGDTFKTTEKGLRFLKTYREIEQMIKVPSLQSSQQRRQQYSVQNNNNHLDGGGEEEKEQEEEESLELKTP